MAQMATPNEVTSINELVDEIIQKCRSVAPPYCEATCPLHLDAKGYVNLIAEGKYAESLALIREKLPFPGILGRICTHPCETKCQRNEVDQTVSIRALKRFVADLEETPAWDLTIEEEKKERVAIVGSGPAGLMAAYDLRKKGYRVTIIEALSGLGGMLRWGIPEYRLPRDILDKELGIIEKLGVEIKLNTRIGEAITLKDLIEGYDAVFLATGAHKSARLGLEGEDTPGVYHGIDFLRKVNMGYKVDVGGQVIVIGGGDVAIDAARSALRLGAEKVTNLYRRTRAEMPARENEVEDALREGIEINYLTAPTKIVSRNGQVSSIECIRMELGEPDASGRRRPVPITGSEFSLSADFVIPAIGQRPDINAFSEVAGLKLTRGRTILVDPVTSATDMEGVFAGGDAVTGPKSAVEALAMGRQAAISIDRFIKGEDLLGDREQEGIYDNPLKMEIPADVHKLASIPIPVLPVEESKGSFKELELGFSEDVANKEAERCLSCECLACKKNCGFLSLHDINPREFAARLKKDHPLDLKVPFSCNICHLCGEMCPEGLDTGKLCHEIRKNAVNEGLAPLPEHKPVHSHQKWVTSRVFKLAMADPQRKRETPRVFFPGCNLPAYSPDLVVKTYNYLRGKLPGTGIIVNCCGAPTYLIGEMAGFKQIMDGITKQMESLGASELITTCAKCHYILKNYAPQWEISSLYEVMVDLGLPEGVPEKFNRVFSVHDSCAARFEDGILRGTRAVLSGVGCEIEEMEFSGERTRCCGGGGMIAPVDPALFAEIKINRVGETLNDIITYCAGCRDNFASVEKPTLHILDLVFNPNWEQDRMKPPDSGMQRWKNRWHVKRHLKRL